ncbi:MAG: FMN-dependent NADH-azoreductase [Gammaproteobacteria bacterium]|nr:FMN-dependent NADH-azoreductase [Gammaproteobacteria bacterium]
MKTVLQLNSSLFQEQGQSSQLTAALVSQLLDSQDRLIVRDLAAAPVPHLTGERFAAFTTAEDERSAAQREVVAYSDKLIAELRDADVIVLGLPMYNFGVPSTLKAYFDHVARAGVTFRYTSNGPQGLLTGKKAYVLATRGGNYEGTPLDSQTPYVRTFLGFLGITDVVFVYAEGLALGEDNKAQALDNANASILEVAA